MTPLPRVGACVAAVALVAAACSGGHSRSSLSVATTLPVVTPTTTATAPTTATVPPGPTLPPVPTTPVQAPPGATAVNLDGQFVVIDPKSDVLALRVGPQTKNLLLVEAAHATVQGAATSLVGLTAGMTLDIVAYGVTVSGHRVFVAVTIIAHPAS